MKPLIENFQCFTRDDFLVERNRFKYTDVLLISFSTFGAAYNILT